MTSSHTNLISLQNVFFNFCKKNSSHLQEVTLRDLTNIMKQVLSISMFDDDINLTVHQFFTRYPLDFFIYLQKRGTFQGRSLLRYYQERDTLDHRGFFQFMRRENDIIYLSALTSGLISSNFQTSQAHQDIIMLLGKIAEFSYFRIYFLLKQFQKTEPEWERIIASTLSEDLRMHNQSRGIDFDSPFGRYAQAGEAIDRFMRFEKKTRLQSI